MSRYRKKPIEIEAVQLGWDTWGEICDFIEVGNLQEGKAQGGYFDGSRFTFTYPGGDPEIALAIPTLEGIMYARQGDYIIKGIQNELYPCKPDIFEQTYERVFDTMADMEAALERVEE